MASNLKCLSQIWNKSLPSEAEQPVVAEASASGSRRQLSRQFKSASDNSQPNHDRLLRSRGVLSSINLNVSNVPKETRKLLQAGAEKANQTFNDVCSAFGACLQKLKKPTRRRQRLVNSSPYTPNRVKGTPKTKQILGRTPTKLYSPFGIETPSERRQRQHQSIYGKPGTYTPTKSGNNNRRLGNKSMSSSSFNSAAVYSPTQALPSDVQHVRQGVVDFNRAAEGVVRRSLRNQMSAAQI